MSGERTKDRCQRVSAALKETPQTLLERYRDQSQYIYPLCFLEILHFHDKALYRRMINSMT